MSKTILIDFFIMRNDRAYFEYHVKKMQELEKAGIDLKNTKAIPMQSQITYKDMKGNEFVRVISKQQELTQDQKEAKKGVRAEILTGYVQKESANLVLQGRYNYFIFFVLNFILEHQKQRQRIQDGQTICKMLLKKRAMKVL